MANVCKDFSELKTVVRCALVATQEALTIEELWKRVLYVFGGPRHVQLKIFGYNTVYDFLKSIPDVVQLEDPEDTNSIVNLISSELSREIEELVSTNIIRPSSPKQNHCFNELMVPYRVQCGFIRVFAELYPKGLSIDDFESNVLYFPIFKQFTDYVNILINNLEHIFLKKGSDMICLQPALMDNLKEIEEEGKFTAMDIFKISEELLTNGENDPYINSGLEYSLSYILEKSILNNIEDLLNDYDWISENDIYNLYIDKFGSSFSHFKRWGFSRVSHMFSKLPELCCIDFSKNDVKIISVKKHTCDKNTCKKTNLVDEITESTMSLSIKDKSEECSNENDGVLAKFLKDDPYFTGSLNNCFLDKKIPNIELRISSSLNVNVCRASSDITPTIICQSLNKSQELENLLIDMKKFYFMNESAFVFNPALIMMNYNYAFFSNDLWFRGIVLVINSNSTKLMDIDNGSIHNIPFDDIRLLHKQFCQLPAQAFSCHLHGIDYIDENELFKVVNKKCTIHIVSTNQFDESVNVKIKFMNSTSDEYLNDEWLKNGVAEQDSLSDE